MNELTASPYFGVALSVIAFGIGVKLQQKLKTPVCNPLIIAIVLIAGVLLIFKIPYDAYNEGGQIINMFLAPATACLAVAIYSKLKILKKYWFPVLVGCTAGSAASMASVYGLCRLFGLDQNLTVSLLPKSVTTPIAGTCYGCGGDLYRNTGQYICSFSDPSVPGKRPGGCRTGDRSFQSCGRHVKSSGTGGDGRSHERACDRNLRDYHSDLLNDHFLIPTLIYRKFFDEKQKGNLLVSEEGLL